MDRPHARRDATQRVVTASRDSSSIGATCVINAEMKKLDTALIFA
ncbi:hypothetical protein L841_0428 [Mycobacterium sp. MAC_080597_8934]|nr:hypothetical protein L840_5053 [Mycobacterium sp. MAC_011194_8550]ETZ74832.1 hypothetical protein L841_0428 [Mycobacterium sp. MAC_080597_8934]